jgi:hypothetical protein
MEIENEKQRAERRKKTQELISSFLEDWKEYFSITEEFNVEYQEKAYRAVKSFRNLMISVFDTQNKDEFLTRFKIIVKGLTSMLNRFKDFEKEE